MNCLSGRAVGRGTKTRMVLRDRGGSGDLAEYGLMAADETHVADEVDRGMLTVSVDGPGDETGDRCEADLVSLALRMTGRRGGEWALREEMRWLGDCERTWRLELKVVVQTAIGGYKSLGSLLVHLEEDENLRYGILMIEALPSARLTRWQECCHFGSHLALLEAANVRDKVQLRAMKREGLGNSLFEVAICHESLNLLQQEVCGSLSKQENEDPTQYLLACLDIYVVRSDEKRLGRRCERRAQSVVLEKQSVRHDGN